MSKVFNTYKLCEITNILAGGDLPDSFSNEKTELLNIPVYSNGEKNNGLYGYTDIPKVTEPAVTISARGSKVGFAAIRTEPFFPIVRLLSLIPYQDKLDVKFLFYNLKLNRQSGIGSGQPQITIPDISNRTISVPDLQTLGSCGPNQSVAIRVFENMFVVCPASINVVHRKHLTHSKL